MGFWTKIKNLFTGKGFKETPIIIPKKEEIKSKQTLQDEISQSGINEIKLEEKIIPKQKEIIIQKPTVLEPNNQLQIVSQKENTELTEKQKEIETQKVLEMQNKIANLGEKNQVQSQLAKTAFSSKYFIPTSQVQELNKTYEDLFSDSMISLRLKNGEIDYALMNVLIKNRKSLQHRFTITFEILTDKGNATLTCFGLLPDDAHLINNKVVLGQKYQVNANGTGYTLHQALQEAGEIFKGLAGCNKYTISTSSSGTQTVTDIKALVTFA